MPETNLLLSLDRHSGEPLHAQLEQRLRADIRSGRLPAAMRLPSSRALAQALQVSRGVVLEAYSQLVAEGYLSASQGAPTRVAEGIGAERAPLPAASLWSAGQIGFDPTMPDLSAFPREDWSRSLRNALRTAPFQALGDPDPRGLPELRNELMLYLGRARAAAPEPDHTIVCSGFTHGFAMLCRVLRDRGVDQIAVEEPGWPRHRLVAERAGLQIVPVPVDAQGISVTDLQVSGCEVVLCTPAHQFPTGSVLGSERRAALLGWAEECDGLIVEDDYDSELRFDRDAVGALQGLAPERVCNIGSLDQRMAPGLALGWVLSPSWLTGALTYEQGAGGGSTPALDQLALADFLARGALDRHLRRTRMALRERRRALVQALAQELPEAVVVGPPAGLFTMVALPVEADEGGVVAAAAAAGVAVSGAGDTEAPALALGYAQAPLPSLLPGVRLLAGALM